MYNLNVGEHYYTHFLDEPNRLNRQALTFEERLAQNRISGRRYQHSDRPYYNTIGSVERRRERNYELPEPSPRYYYEDFEEPSVYEPPSPLERTVRASSEWSYDRIRKQSSEK